MNMRPRLTYANVVATLAHVLAIGGGTVYAAIHLGKDSVRSKNIAAGAVKSSDLGKNAVTGPKVKNGTIATDDLTAGVIAKLQADVSGSATAGPAGGVNTNTTSPLPLSGKTTFTPRAGDVSAVAAEARFSIATTDPAESCRPAVFLLLNDQPTRIFVDPEGDANSTTLVKDSGRDASGPYGLIDPGDPLTITAQLRGDDNCTADSQLDRLEVRNVQIR
jgi:hypothetical protein